jgi:hypothetical protein
MGFEVEASVRNPRDRDIHPPGRIWGNGCGQIKMSSVGTQTTVDENFQPPIYHHNDHGR